MAAPAAPADARDLALQILEETEKGRSNLDRIVQTALGARPDLARRDRALVFALVYGVQRWRRRLDWVAAHFASRPFDRIEATVRQILRLALFQLLFLTRVPPSAAVHTAVAMTKTRVPRAASFVNALLRSALRRGLQVPLPDLDADPVKALGVGLSFPDWIVARWIDRDGLAAARARCTAANRLPLLAVRANTLKTDREALLNLWRTEGLQGRPTPLAPDGIVIEGFQGNVDNLPGFSRGYFQVQDEAAQLVGLLLAPKPGQRILDACAGLGGKTGHLAALGANQAEILATDQAPDRLAALALEMRRLGAQGIHTRTVDWQNAPPLDGLPVFDRILLDAPCSGLGVLGRNPDGRWRRRAADLTRCARRQQTLLGHLADLLKPDGLLVYAVCSLEPEETCDVIRAFLQRRADYGIAPPADVFAACAGPLIRAGGAVLTDPGKNPLDGFYMIGLQRRRAADP